MGLRSLRCLHLGQTSVLYWITFDKQDSAAKCLKTTSLSGPSTPEIRGRKRPAKSRVSPGSAWERPFLPFCRIPGRGSPPPLACCSPAQAAHEALGVVGAAQRRDDLARDKVPAAVTAGAVELLVVLGADVLLVLEEEA